MAIAVKSMNAIAAIKLLDVASSLVDWLEKNPVQVQLLATKFVLSADLNDGPFSVEVPVKLNDLHSLSKGTMPNAAKGMLQTQLTKAIQQLILKSKDSGWPGAELAGLSVAEKIANAPIVDPSNLKPAVGALNKLPPLKPSVEIEPETPPMAASSAWPTFDLKKLSSAPTVKLRDATQMYQPVQGTSQGSRYFMVAAGSGLRVAARYDGSSLSVRIEGDKLKEHKTKIVSNQFKTGANNDYASLHLEVGDLAMASKTLGAILLGLNIPMETPLPQLEKVANA